MNINKPIRRRNVKRRRVRRTTTASIRPSAQSPLLTPEALEKLRQAFAEWKQPPPAFTLSPAITPPPPPQKSFGELLLEVLSEAYKPVWKKDSPGSYAFNRAIYAVAPHCGPEVSGWLNLGAMITFVFGFKQVVDQANRRDH